MISMDEFDKQGHSSMNIQSKIRPRTAHISSASLGVNIKCPNFVRMPVRDPPHKKVKSLVVLIKTIG